MRFLDLEFLRQAVDLSISACQAVEISIGTAPCRVYRLVFFYPDGTRGPASAILKVIEPNWEHDPFGPDRELNFYRQLLPKVDIPKPGVYFAGDFQETGQRVILMEDLSITHRIPPSNYVWSRAELVDLLKVYARFHSSGQGALPPAAERSWLYTYPAEPLPDTDLQAMAGELYARSLFPALPGLSKLAGFVRDRSAAWASLPATLNHNDVYPSNAALPCNPAGQVILLDWDMAGWGPAEMDLAYLFLQPYRSSRSLSPSESLQIYWAERQRLEGTRVPVKRMLAAQRLADARLALALLPVAYRAATHPFPPGSKASCYWEAMFTVLGERLEALTRWR